MKLGKERYRVVFLAFLMIFALSQPFCALADDPPVPEASEAPAEQDVLPEPEGSAFPEEQEVSEPTEGTEEPGESAGQDDPAPPEDAVAIELPAMGEHTLDFILDPQGLIEATGAARYDGADFESGATIFFKRADGAFSSRSEALTVTNYSTCPVTVTVRARIDVGDFDMSAYPTFSSDDTRPALYLALVDDEGAERPIAEYGDATLSVVLEAEGDSYSFGLRGACNPNGEWQDATAEPVVTVSWDVEPIYSGGVPEAALTSEQEQDPIEKPEAETPEEEMEPETPAEEPEPETPAEEPEPEIPAEEPEPETLTEGPEPETPAEEPEPEIPAEEPEPETPAEKPEPETPAGEPEPETPAGEPEPETPAGEPEPETPEET